MSTRRDQYSIVSRIGMIIGENTYEGLIMVNVKGHNKKKKKKSCK